MVGKKYLQYTAVALHTASAAAQTIKAGGETIPATSENVSPAAVNVSSPLAESGLFASETLQLTQAVLANLTALELSNVSLFGFGGNSSVTTTRSLSPGTCKTFPGDPMWPSDIVWDVFDLLLGGALIKTKPLASPCYTDFGDYDAEQCEWLTANWSNDSFWQTDDPTSINAELYENSTCLPPAIWPEADATNCTLGSYPPYSVNVSTVAQIQLAINLARTLDLRLVVKNTGHDFNGKSTGAGALNVWTHNLKDIQFLPSYEAVNYTGPAMKLGAGVQASEMYEACYANNVTCVGGEGKSVGVMGGYIQGGGHSPLSSLVGLAADQVLKYEVVLADGSFVTADATQNTDLFWALRGGGGGTFGVVTSVIVKAHPQMTTSYTTFTITNTGNISTEAFWAAIKLYWDGFPTWTAANTYSYFWISPLGNDTFEFWMEAFFAPNSTAAELEALTAPLFANWTALGVSINPVYSQFDSAWEAADSAFPLETWGNNIARQSGRLFPRDNWANETILAESFDAIRWVSEAGLYVYGFHMAPGQHAYPDNAVNPAWRQTLGHIMMSYIGETSIWSTAEGVAQYTEISKNLTDVYNARWRALTPGSGAYLSECDYMEPDWQQSLWGDKYERLYAIKKSVDPYDLFWVPHGVGSEGWETDSYVLSYIPSQNGKLCRV